MSNFEKLVQAGLANDGFTADEQAEINDLSESTVNKIIAAANVEQDLTGSIGQQ